MNYREFNERVYNYKHGIKTVADDQSNSIEHSAKGDEWDSHKYKEKIYLGEGKYRYIYDDGTSSTGYKPLDYNDPARQQQRAKPLVDNFNARVETKETAQGISNKLALDNQMQQGKAQEAERKEAGTMSESYKTANDIGDFLKENVQSPSNRDFTNARKESYDAENKAKAPQAAPSAPVPYAQQDKELASGKSEEEKRKAAGTPNASVAGKVNTAVTANNIGSFLRNNIDNPQNATNGVLPDAAKSTDLGSTATGIADALNNKKEGRVEGTPYDQLNAKSVAATNNPVNTAQNIADSYLNEINKLKDFATRAGMSEAEFWKIVDAYETVHGGDVVASSLNGVDRNNINWMEGADASMQNYMSNVLPKIQEGIADRMNKMKPNNVGNAEPVKDAVPNENAVPAQQSPYERYIRERGYNPYNIKGSDLKALFPSMYNENFNDNEYYGLNDSDQTFIPVSSVDPNKWYNSETGEFVSGNTSSEDNGFYKAFRSSFYNATLNNLRNNSSYSALFTDQELQDIAMQMTNSYVENMKNAAAK